MDREILARLPWEETPRVSALAAAVALAAVLIASGRIASTYTVFSHTTDEPGHLGCGMRYLAGYVCPYEYAPLSRGLIALGPHLAGARSHHLADVTRDGLAILYDNYTRYLALARLSVLPFFWIACAAIFFWGRRSFSNATAALAVLLFSLLPPVLAHAGLATADMAQTGLLATAFLSWLIWAERPTFGRSAATGSVTALAILAKFSTCGFLPVILAITLMCYILLRRPPAADLRRMARARLRPFGVAALAALLVFWAGYRFTFGSLDHVSLPAPQLFAALRFVLYFNTAGSPAYLLGRFSDSGWWYYYPAALALKTPLAFLILVAWWPVSRRNGWRNPRWIAPAAFSTGILLVGMLSRVNIGTRHVLPVYCGLSLLAADGMVRLLRSEKARHASASIACMLLCWLVGTGAAKHPDYLAYFNELAPREPEDALVDSDLDWGQDLNRLARRLHQLGAADVRFSTFVPAELETGHSFPPVKPIDPHVPSPGWTAVSPTWWKLRQFEMSAGYRGGPLWLERARPAERIGSLLLFHFPEK